MFANRKAKIIKVARAKITASCGNQANQKCELVKFFCKTFAKILKQC